MSERERERERNKEREINRCTEWGRYRRKWLNSIKVGLFLLENCLIHVEIKVAIWPAIALRYCNMSISLVEVPILSAKQLICCISLLLNYSPPEQFSTSCNQSVLIPCHCLSHQAPFDRVFSFFRIFPTTGLILVFVRFPSGKVCLLAFFLQA